MIAKIKDFFTKGDARSVLVKRNIVASVALRGISILASLAIVPLTIDYVNEEQYGIWTTLSSMVMWFQFLDIGIAMGLRNRFAEAKARGEHQLVKQYVSTAYAVMIAIALGIVAVAAVVCSRVDFSAVLNVAESYRPELSDVMLIMLAGFALTLLLSVMTNILIGDQLMMMSSLIGVAGQVMILGAIYYLVSSQGHGTLVELALMLSLIPPAVWLVATVVLFFTRYRAYYPSAGAVRLSLVKNLLGIGVKFFVINVAMIFIYQMILLIISRELGPVKVTEYNVAWKYFNVANMVANLVLAPFWAASTDAYTRGNLSWIRNKLRQLEMMAVGLLVPGVGLMLALSTWFFHLWVGDSVTVSLTTSISIAVYTVVLSWANVYMYIMNGIGKVMVQLVIYSAFAVVAFPLMSLLCRHAGIPGLLIIPGLIYVIQAIAMRVQLVKLFSGKARGIWDK